MNSTTAVAGKAGFTLASPATAVVEFMAKWLNMYRIHCIRARYLGLQPEMTLVNGIVE